MECPNCGNKGVPKDASTCPFCNNPIPKDTHIPSIMQVAPEDLIEASRRKVMKEKQDKAPKVKEKEKDKYICPNPDCLKDSLSYNEEERLFICSECKRKYALAEIEE